MIVTLVSKMIGGLQPIPRHIAIDLYTLWCMLYVNFTSIRTPSNLYVLLFSCGFLLFTCGPTGRWSISLPMIPFIVIQLLRRVPFFSRFKWSRGLLGFLGVWFIVLAAILCILIPAVQIPSPDGPYRVGILEFHLPVDFSDDNTTCTSHSELPVKLFYPTLDPPGQYPYLNPSLADEYCRKVMQFGAPPPLQSQGWMLHNWKLATLPAKWNATLLPLDRRLPIVIFSHGLGGTADVYSYQTMALASNGYVVLVLTHQDRSAPVVALSNGTEIHYDFELAKLLLEEKHSDYVKERRRRTDHRVQELIAAVEAIHRMDQQDIPGLGISLQGRLSKSETFFMGHSFGGATALTAGKRRPDLVTAIVAHEPAVDWMPDDARHSLLPPTLLQDFDHSWQGGTGGYEGFIPADDNGGSIHEKDILILFSQEWRDKKWAGSDALEEMDARKRLGTDSGISACKSIPDISHNEFSDTCLMTPVWVGRATGITGKRNPVETAKEIEHITKVFLENVRQRSK